MKNIGIIIHSRPAYDMEWHALLPVSTLNNSLILIASAGSIEKLTNLNRNAFISIYETQTFDFEHLEVIFHKIHQEFYEKGDKTKVSTVAEYDMILTAELRDHFREMLSIEGPDLQTILNFRDKLQMKAVLANTGVRIPRYVKFDRSLFINDNNRYIEHVDEYLQFPIFAKPIDGASSIGTSLISNKQELREWCLDKLTLSQDFELDEYITGNLFHCDSIVKNGNIVFTFVSRYLHPNADAQHGLPLATMTLDSLDPNYKRLKDFAENALKQFTILPDGCTHLEVFISNKNELVFLEVAARPPGSKAPEMYQRRTNGIDIRAVHTKLNLGFDIEDEIHHLLDEKRWGPYASMWDLVSPKEDSIIEELHSPILDSNYQIIWKYQRLDTVPGGTYNADVIASVVFWHSNYSLLVNDFNNLGSQRLVSMKNQPLIPTALIPINRIKALGCTAITYPIFFNQRKLAFSAATVISQIGEQATNNLRHNPQQINTNVDPTLLVAFIVGSASIVALLLYAVWRILPKEDDEVLANSAEEIGLYRNGSS